MMNVKSIVICAALALFSISCAAQIKVIDRSAKKAPSWINGIEKNYLIVSATANDVEEAKEKILNTIREQIVRSIAVNVQSSTSLNIQEVAMDGKVRKFLETTGTTTLTKSGNIPYLNEISLANITDFYWEKQQDKKSKATTVVYHVRYPFPDVQMQRLVFEFKQADKKMNDRLLELCETIDKVARIEDISKAVEDLKQIHTFFDDSRQNKAQACINNYNQLYSYISLEEVTHDTGSLSYRITLNNRPLVSTQTPRVKSNCADNIKLQVQDDVTTVTYKTEGCYASLDNYIEVVYTFGGKNIAQKFFFTIVE